MRQCEIRRISPESISKWEFEGKPNREVLPNQGLIAATFILLFDKYATRAPSDEAQNAQLLASVNFLMTARLSKSHTCKLPSAPRLSNLLPPGRNCRNVML